MDDGVARKGQTLPVVIIISLGALLFFFATPLLFDAAGIGASQTSGFMVFFIRLFPFLLAVVVIARWWRSVSQGARV